MTFYESETNTIIARPMKPLRERTTYAVVVTKRIKDADGKSIGSPYPFINHIAQNEALAPLADVLGPELALDDVAFAWTFTTQTIEAGWVAVREGLFGFGVQKHLAKDYPADLNIAQVRTPEDLGEDAKVNIEGSDANPYVIYTENVLGIFDAVGDQLFNIDRESATFKELIEGLSYIDYHVMGSFKSPQLFQRTYADRYAPTCDELCAHVRQCGEERQHPELAKNCMDDCLGTEADDEDVEETGWTDAQRACRFDRCGGFEACSEKTPWLHYEEQSGQRICIVSG